jgi:hypothetical protein
VVNWNPQSPENRRKMGGKYMKRNSKVYLDVKKMMKYGASGTPTSSKKSSLASERFKSLTKKAMKSKSGGNSSKPKIRKAPSSP